MACAHSEDPDQPGHSCSLIKSLRCLHEEILDPWLPINMQQRLIRLGGCQADQSLRWVHRSFCWFCHAAAHISGVNDKQ